MGNGRVGTITATVVDPQAKIHRVVVGGRQVVNAIPDKGFSACTETAYSTMTGMRCVRRSRTIRRAIGRVLSRKRIGASDRSIVGNCVRDQHWRSMRGIGQRGRDAYRWNQRKSKLGGGGVRTIRRSIGGTHAHYNRSPGIGSA